MSRSIHVAVYSLGSGTRSGRVGSGVRTWSGPKIGTYDGSGLMIARLSVLSALVKRVKQGAHKRRNES